MKVSVDQFRCASSGRCIWYTTGVFGQDPETGVVQLLMPNPPPEAHEAVRDAAENCPTQAITIEE